MPDGADHPESFIIYHRYSSDRGNDMPSSEPIKDKLASNATRVDAYIDSVLKPRRPEMLYEASRHLISAGGKRLRPFLVLKSCEAVGGKAEEALPFAAALEILHNFTLIHDDIMDKDELRRGAPTVHTKWSVPIAVAAGDLLFAKVYEVMASQRLSPKRLRECIQMTTEAAIEICEGQVLDISFPDTTEVTEEDYLFMVEGKTSALFKACAEIGATVGGGSKRQVAALGRFAWDAGIAFQLVDDCLGVTADEKTLGKPVGSDLREGKKTLIVIHALNHASAKQKTKIRSVLGSHTAAAGDIAEVNTILRKTLSIDYAFRKADRYVAKAKTSISGLPESKAKKDLLDLIDYFSKRSY
jgi:geranylgeranyl diphosphate synthase type I